MSPAPKEVFRAISARRKRPVPRDAAYRLGRNERVVDMRPEHLRAMLSTLVSDDIVALPDLAGFYDKLCAWQGIDFRNVLAFSGSDTAIKSLFDVYVDAGDEVVIWEPSYHRYRKFAALSQAVIVPVPFHYPGVGRVEDVLARIGAKTRLVIVDNPNNPTGHAFTDNELLAILDRVEAHDALLLVDEAYFEFAGLSMRRHVPARSSLIVSRTFSKAMGAAGLRIGFLMGAEAVMTELAKVKLNYEITGTAAKCAIYLMDRTDEVDAYVSRVIEARHWLQARLSQFAVVAPSLGNFLFVELPPDCDAEACEKALAARGFELSTGYQPPFERFVRVTVGPRPIAEKFLAALQGHLLASAPERQLPA